jgi:hypothetical protein
MSEATLTEKAHMAFLQEMADHGHQLNVVMYFSMISGLTKACSAWSYDSMDSMSRRATRRHGMISSLGTSCISSGGECQQTVMWDRDRWQVGASLPTKEGNV